MSANPSIIEPPSSSFANPYEQTKDYCFFYRGPFSQWYFTNFKIDGIMYNCAEQYMMAAKARHFGDFVTEKKILKARYPSEQKALGRDVRNFTDAAWEKVDMQLVIAGNMAKFKQNLTLKTLLANTHGMLVECAPDDPKWGIGLSMSDPRRLRRLEWRGKNKLGIALTNVRENIPSWDWPNKSKG